VTHQPRTLTVEAVLVDLDGTLVDTSAAVEGSWRALAAELAVPWERFAPHIHGIPADQVLAAAVPDRSRRARERLAAAILAQQTDSALEVSALPGAAELTRALAGSRWAIVTSGGVRLASCNLAKAGLPRPPVLVTADDVATGKPHPEPYLRAAERLGVDPRRCVAFEDAPAGIAAARAAGAVVIAVTTTHSARQLQGADRVIPDLAGVTIGRTEGTVTLTLADYPTLP
jgi:sugar-phosphatase